VREVEMELVGAEPSSEPEAGLHLYHVADDPAHGFVYRALLRQPGVVVLEEWGLHRLVHAETAGKGDVGAYLREARRAHGETGAFLARQVVRGLGGAWLPALLAMNDRVLEASLGLVATSEAVRARAAARLPGRLVVHLPLAFAGGPPLPARSEARAALGLRPEQLVVVAVHPGRDVGPPEPIVRALGRVGEAYPGVPVLWAAEDDPQCSTRLAAADVVVALEHPVRAGVAPAVAAAVAAGRPTLVTAGSGVARELPEGVIVPVSPGATEGEEVEALVRRLLADARLRERIGGLARTHLAALGDPGRVAGDLVKLVREVAASREATLRAIAADRATEGTLAAWALEEVRWGAHDLGLADLPVGLGPLVESLFGSAR
jgi:hypothetical protein